MSSTLRLAHALRAHVLPRMIVLMSEPLFRLGGFRKRGCTAPALERIRRVLVVRSDGIGDVVLSSPLLRELRVNLPKAWITLLVSPATRDVAERCPYADEVLTHEWSVGPRSIARSVMLVARALGVSRRHLWRRRYDLAISPKGDLDYYDAKLIVYFSGAPCRLGYAQSGSTQTLRFLESRLYYTQLLEHGKLRHEVQRGLDLVAYLGGTVRKDSLELWTDAADETRAEELLREHGVRPGDLVVSFGVGARAAKRKWPVASFVALGRWLIDEYQARIVVLGSAEETALGNALVRELGANVIDAVGRTSLREAGALLRRCSLHIGNDSGPMHLAAAAGTPIVEISCHPAGGREVHPNSPARFGPWQVAHTIVQPAKAMSPCADECRADHAHCILRVSVEDIRAAVYEQLAAQRGPQHVNAAH